MKNLEEIKLTLKTNKQTTTTTTTTKQTNKKQKQQQPNPGVNNLCSKHTNLQIVKEAKALIERRTSTVTVTCSLNTVQDLFSGLPSCPDPGGIFMS